MAVHASRTRSNSSPVSSPAARSCSSGGRTSFTSASGGSSPMAHDLVQPVQLGRDLLRIRCRLERERALRDPMSVEQNPARISRTRVKPRTSSV